MARRPCRSCTSRRRAPRCCRWHLALVVFVELLAQPLLCVAAHGWRDHGVLSLLGAEGKALGRDFIVRLIKSGVKPTISGDLWSDGGMGLFGIYAHGISESWVMEKALIGLVACETERHTAENITKWTKDALLGIGLKAGDLLKPADGGA